MKPLVLALLLVLSVHAADVSMGHLHLNVKDLDASKKFFIETLGGTAGANVGTNVSVQFPDVIVLLKKQDPTGNSADSAVNHVGFKVKDLAAFRTKLKAAGYPVEDNPNGVQLFTLTPDGLRIELSEEKTMTVPIANHHIHFFNADIEGTQAWYDKMFGAKPGMRGRFKAGDLPGVNLSYSESKTAVPTKGRALDHIGFEVKGLEAFCKELETKGVKFDVPFRNVPAIKLKLAFLTDPYGTYIELTEGLK